MSDLVREQLESVLAPDGSVFFVDSLASEDSTARDQAWTTDGVVERRLNDGRGYRIIKMFYDAAELMDRLAALGWSGDVRSTPNFFLHGHVRAAR